MTPLLEKALSKLNNLPDAEQDRYAAELLADLEAEAEWDKLFASEASQKWLEKAAAEVRQDHVEGRVRELGCDKPAG